tara:strand:- start:1053 stop:2132 length:1080 start_codon:yes stop_codon:yes gene_type:complete
MTRAEVLEIQEALSELGHDPGKHDGLLGPATLGAAVDLAHTQGWHEYADALAGGQVPAAYINELQVLRANIEATEPEQSDLGISRVGAWVWGNQLSRKHAQAIQRADALGLSDVALFATPEAPARKGKFSPRIDEARMIQTCVDYMALGMDTHVTCWLHTDRSYLLAMRRYVDALVAQDCIESLEWDTEHMTNQGRGVSQEALADVVEIFADLPIPIAITGYGFATGRDKRLTDELVKAGVSVQTFGQAYSVAFVNRGGKRMDTTPKSVYYPGRSQKAALSKGSWGRWRHDSRVETCLGLAAYKQPKGKESEWMETCIETTEELGIQTVRYWSLLTLTGAAGAVVSELCKRAAERRLDG